MKKLNSQLYAVTEDELKNIDPHDNNNLYVTDAIVENGQLKKAGKIVNSDGETVGESLTEAQYIRKQDYYDEDTYMEAGDEWVTIYDATSEYSIALPAKLTQWYIPYILTIKAGTWGFDGMGNKLTLKQDYYINDASPLQYDTSIIGIDIPMEYWESEPVE